LIGTATPEGSYEGLEHKLKYFKELGNGSTRAQKTFVALTTLLIGVNTLEILPLADFPGQCNWGYDGVCLYAPARCYGTPDQLRHLINAAHNEGYSYCRLVYYNMRTNLTIVY
jgi:maltooligosyltrehalose trehalohydrolase